MAEKEYWMKLQEEGYGLYESKCFDDEPQARRAAKTMLDSLTKSWGLKEEEFKVFVHRITVSWCWRYEIWGPTAQSKRTNVWCSKTKSPTH